MLSGHDSICDIAPDASSCYLIWGGTSNVNLARLLALTSNFHGQIHVLDYSAYLKRSRKPFFVSSDSIFALHKVVVGAATELIDQHTDNTSKVHVETFSPTIRYQRKFVKRELRDIVSLSQLAEWEYRGHPAGRSVASHIVTTSLRDSNPDQRRWRPHAQRLMQIYCQVFDETAKYLELAEPSDVLVMENDRHAAEAPLLHLCHQFNLLPTYLTFDDGDVGQSTGVVAYSTYNLESIRTDFELNEHKLDAQRGAEIVLGRLPDPGVNSFASWAQPASSVTPTSPDGRIATVFLSSPDEYVFLGDDWRNLRWENQEIAMREVCQHLRSLDLRVVVRVHPNAVNKSWREFMAVHRLAGEVGDVIVSATSSISSYDLIRSSDVVVTWGSTVALEAVAREKPAWILSPTTFESCVDIRRWPDHGHPDLKDLLYTPLQTTAFKFADFWFGKAGTQISDSVLYQELRRLDESRNHLDLTLRKLLFPYWIRQSPVYVYLGLRWVVGEIRARRLFHRAIIALLSTKDPNRNWL